MYEAESEAQWMRDWAAFLLSYRFALKEVETKLTIINEEFQFMHDSNPIEHIKSRIKSPDSIFDKLKRKGVPVTIQSAYEHIRDIAGVRVICSFATDIFNIYQMLAAQDDVTVLEVKDYVNHPKANGYRSLHMLIEIPVFLTNRVEHVPVEIQIRTIAMDFWASLEHKIFYKFNENVPLQIKEQLKEAAEITSILDERMLSLNEAVNKIRNDEVDRT